MMGRQRRDQGRLFYEFRLEGRIPENHLLRRINVFVTVALADLHKEFKPHYSDIGRPSVDPELMIRMLIVGYCYGIRSERKLCQEAELHLAYRWFCKLDLDDETHTTRRSLRTGSGASARATCCATSSNASCGRRGRLHRPANPPPERSQDPADGQRLRACNR
jgi:transposase